MKYKETYLNLPLYYQFLISVSVLTQPSINRKYEVRIYNSNFNITK